ncbi:DUF3530 family protein [Aliiglaciecola sp. LCG003]|uniref:DUF3530 family protein n=1 Tax=Aliiglaciecola sp. LCG003 TaxID=3053655 RepID=UPI002572C807|nr:DUF3530 family protein [Aliiglaciecola sp. LCG003]WJG08963.1 DUF3530 family protein [Aliiglaciecola sp. LCG003]
MIRLSVTKIHFARKFLLLTILLCATIRLGLAQSADLDIAMEDIQHQQFADSFDVLLVGEAELPLIIQESSTPITRGVAVMISESGRGPFSQHGLNQLAIELNKVGWVTMIMPAPVAGFAPSQNDDAQQQNQQPAPAPETSQTEQNPSNQETVSPRSGQQNIATEQFSAHQQQLILQLRAVTQKTRQYPGFFLVIAQGTSAAWLTKIYAEKVLDLPDGMVAVSPYWPQRDYNKQLPEWIAKTEMPYLDIFTPFDPQWSLMTVGPRKIAAVKGLKLMYRQRELTGQKMDQQQLVRLGKEIYGWLTHLGW